jgi:amino acid adenylation domain-containing protein
VLTSAALAHSMSAEVHLPVVNVDAEMATDANAQSGLESCGTVSDLAYVIYTSGSTGVPKGVLNTHRGISNHLAWMGEAFPLSGADRMLVKTPAVFDVSVWEWFWPLSQGACLVLTPSGSEKEPLHLLETIESQRITNIHFVPTMLRLMLERSDLHRCQTLARVFCSGEALTSEIRDRFFERMTGSPALVNLYGPTETAVHVTGWICRRDETGAVPIGRPLANVRAYIVDEALNPVAEGVKGELLIGGVQVAAGYHQRQELTHTQFIPDPFDESPEARCYRTGDCVSWRGDGAIDFFGRYDSQIQLGGVRVELGEIEAALRRHPEVGDAAVLVRETDEPARLVAYLRRAAGNGSRLDPPIDSVRRVLAETLPDYMMPGSFIWLDSFPVTPTGKLDRGALPETDAARPAMEQAFEPPRAGAEARLARLWSDQLRIERIGRHDDFRVLGGDSITSVRLVSAIESEFGVGLAPGEILRSPTIARLAMRLEKSRAPLAASSIVALRPGDAGRPLFLPPSMGGELDYWRELLGLLPPGRPVYGFTVPDGFEGPAVELRELAAAMARDLLAFQSEGPYHLAGYSFSAALALEIAQQLRASGRTVGLLAMIDYGPGTAPSWLGRARTAGYFLANLPYWLSDDILKTGWRAVASRTRRKLATLGQKIASIGRQTTEQLAEWEVDEMYPSADLSRRHRRLIVDHLGAFFRYQPTPYDGRVILFRARSRPLLHSLAPSLGWNEYSTGFDRINVRCTHDNILTAPHVRVIAEGVEKALRDLDAASPTAGVAAGPLLT